MHVHGREADFGLWSCKLMSSLGTQSWALPLGPFSAKPRPSTIVRTTSASSIEFRDSVIRLRGVFILRPVVWEITPGVSKYRV